MKCTNQQIKITFNNEPVEYVGKIHGDSTMVEMIDSEGFNWGIFNLCDDCIREHKGWTVNKIKDDI